MYAPKAFKSTRLELHTASLDTNVKYIVSNTNWESYSGIQHDILVNYFYAKTSTVQTGDGDKLLILLISVGDIEVKNSLPETLAHMKN